MKKIFLLLIITLLWNCETKSRIYDLSTPILEDVFYYKDSIVYQFNEPINNISLNFGKRIYNHKQEQFISNIEFHEDTFKNASTSFKITAFDSSNNKYEQQLSSPIINKTPAKIKINKIRLGYTKKRNQFIELKVFDTGNTDGHHLIIHLFRNKFKLPIVKDTIQLKNKKLTIAINSTKEPIKNTPINFNNGSYTLNTPYRLSNTNGTIYIQNHKSEITNYILYYNSKKKDLQKHLQNKSFKKILDEFKAKGIVNPVLTDVNGTTSTKIILNIDNKFVIDKKT